jgi:tRNA G18 (ribose-2'-O)-methylase SpoU
LQKNADFLITIPTEGKTSSLNVSVACGIIISMIKIKQK